MQVGNKRAGGASTKRGSKLVIEKSVLLSNEFQKKVFLFSEIICQLAFFLDKYIYLNIYIFMHRLRLRRQMEMGEVVYSISAYGFLPAFTRVAEARTLHSSPSNWEFGGRGDFSSG